MQQEYVPANYKGSAYHCPYCHVYAKQDWYSRVLFSELHVGTVTIDNMMGCICAHCQKASFWLHEQMVIPSSSIAPPASPDMPDDVKAVYQEAANVLAISPKASAALLRLGLQHLCKFLGEEGKDINKDIGALVAKGLPPSIQKALDTVRVIGNESVHPGTLDINDKPDVALALFKLMNFIVYEMITRPKEIDAMFSTLPAGKLKGIEDRDKNSSPPMTT